MTTTIDIEEANAADDELVEAMRQLIPQLTSTAPVPTRQEIGEIIASPSTTLLVARDRALGGRIAGTLTLAMYRIPTGVRAWIEDVTVDGAARGKGIGEALTKAAIRIAGEKGARTIELSSRASREAANRLYQRVGFVRRETNVYRYTLPAGGDSAVPS